MNLKKQIEEMAKAVCVNCTSEVCASGRCAYQYDCPLSMETIKRLHLKGYRKASEVAREIFEELEYLARQMSSPITIAALFETQQYKEFKNKHMGYNNEIRTEN